MPRHSLARNPTDAAVSSVGGEGGKAPRRPVRPASLFLSLSKHALLISHAHAHSSATDGSNYSLLLRTPLMLYVQCGKRQRGTLSSACLADLACLVLCSCLLYVSCSVSSYAEEACVRCVEVRRRRKRTEARRRWKEGERRRGWKEGWNNDMGEMERTARAAPREASLKLGSTQPSGWPSFHAFVVCVAHCTQAQRR